MMQYLKDLFPRTLYEEVLKQRQCRRICATLQKNQDVKPLNAALKRRIKKYASEALGGRHYCHWLYVYTLNRGSFVEGWIPEDFFKKVLPHINGSYRSIATAKTLSARILRTTTLPDQVYCVNGSWFDVQGNKLQSSEVKNIIFNQDQTAFVKMDESYQGQGIIVIQKDTFDEARLLHIAKNFVVQRTIVQAEWFDDISPGCVATLRITTGLPAGGSPGLCAAYLRLGRKGAKFVSSAQALKIPVVNNEGKLGDFALDPDWIRCYSHPDSGAKFEGRKIPHFTHAVSLCVKLHEKVPQFTVVGWDVAITESGLVELMEWNAGLPDIKFSEATTGPCFKHLHLERFA